MRTHSYTHSLLLTHETRHHTSHNPYSNPFTYKLTHADTQSRVHSHSPDHTHLCVFTTQQSIAAPVSVLLRGAAEPRVWCQRHRERPGSYRLTVAQQPFPPTVSGIVSIMSRPGLFRVSCLIPLSCSRRSLIAVRQLPV